MKFKYQIPNLLTLSNLICGALSIYSATLGSVSYAAYFILAGAVFDLLDGMVARMLGVDGAMGKELDSLADVVSFGVAPAFISLSLLGTLNQPHSFSFETIIAFSPLLLTAFAAYRLAKFNIDTRQSDSFIGMPTPAMALFWLSMPLIAEGLSPDANWLDGIYYAFLNSKTAIIVAVVVTSFLMVAELPLLALKFKNFKMRGNAYRFVLISSSLVLILLLAVKAVPIILLLYIVLSIVENITTGKNGIQS